MRGQLILVMSILVRAMVSEREAGQDRTHFKSHVLLNGRTKPVPVDHLTASTTAPCERSRSTR